MFIHNGMLVCRICDRELLANDSEPKVMDVELVPDGFDKQSATAMAGEEMVLQDTLVHGDLKVQVWGPSSLTFRFKRSA